MFTILFRTSSKHDQSLLVVVLWRATLTSLESQTSIVSSPGSHAAQCAGLSQCHQSSVGWKPALVWQSNAMRQCLGQQTKSLCRQVVIWNKRHDLHWHSSSGWTRLDSWSATWPVPSGGGGRGRLILEMEPSVNISGRKLRLFLVLRQSIWGSRYPWKLLFGNSFLCRTTGTLGIWVLLVQQFVCVGADTTFLRTLRPYILPKSERKHVQNHASISENLSTEVGEGPLNPQSADADTWPAPKTPTISHSFHEEVNKTTHRATWAVSCCSLWRLRPSRWYRSAANCRRHFSRCQTMHFHLQTREILSWCDEGRIPEGTRHDWAASTEVCSSILTIHGYSWLDPLFRSLVHTSDEHVLCKTENNSQCQHRGRRNDLPNRRLSAKMNTWSEPFQPGFKPFLSIGVHVPRPILTPAALTCERVVDERLHVTRHHVVALEQRRQHGQQELKLVSTIRTVHVHLTHHNSDRHVTHLTENGFILQFTILWQRKQVSQEPWILPRILWCRSLRRSRPNRPPTTSHWTPAKRTACRDYSSENMTKTVFFRVRGKTGHGSATFLVHKWEKWHPPLHARWLRTWSGSPDRPWAHLPTGYWATTRSSEGLQRPHKSVGVKQIKCVVSFRFQLSTTTSHQF